MWDPGRSAREWGTSSPRLRSSFFSRRSGDSYYCPGCTRLAGACSPDAASTRRGRRVRGGRLPGGGGARGGHRGDRHGVRLLRQGDPRRTVGHRLQRLRAGGTAPRRPRRRWDLWVSTVRDARRSERRLPRTLRELHRSTRGAGPHSRRDLHLYEGAPRAGSQPAGAQAADEQAQVCRPVR
jgi:hypothetical protein